MPRGLLEAVGMLVTVILILVLAWWTTRWISARGISGGNALPVGAGGGSLEVVERLAVGRTASLLLLRTGDRYCLLGVTEGQITLLKEWQGEEAAWIQARRETSPAGFGDILREVLRKKQ